MPLTTQCPECHKDFTYQVLEGKPTLCPVCQVKADRDMLTQNLVMTIKYRDDLINRLGELKRQHELAQDHASELKDLWSYYAREYKTFDREVANIKYNLQELKAPKIKSTPKVKVSKNLTPAEMAMAALKALPADQRAALLAVANKL